MRRTSESRFSVHPLVRKFAAGKLARSRSRRSSIRARHRAHYLRLLRAQRPRLYGPQHLQAIQLLESDLDNIRGAWGDAVASGDVVAVAAAAHSLCLLFDRLGLYDEWTRTFEHALAAVAPGPGAETRAAHVRLMIAAANGHWRRGDAAQAAAFRPQLEEALAATSAAAERAELLKLLGLLTREAGDLEGALSLFADGTRQARAAGDLITEAQLVNESGVVHFRRGDIEKAREAFAASVAKVVANAFEFDLPVGKHNVGYCDLELGRFDAAQVSFDVALRAFRGRRDARGEAMVLSSLGILARRRGDLGQALEHAHASLGLAERAANRGAIADAIDDLAQVLEQRGDLDGARTQYRRALAMAQELGQVHLQCFVLLHLARTEAAAADRTAASKALREALDLACARDFQSGTLLGVLGVAGLRASAGDAAATAVAGTWCSAVLAVAGTSVDVLAAVPDVLRERAAPCTASAPAPSLDAVLADARAYLDELVTPPVGGR